MKHFIHPKHEQKPGQTPRLLCQWDLCGPVLIQFKWCEILSPLQNYGQYIYLRYFYFFLPVKITPYFGFKPMQRCSKPPSAKKLLREVGGCEWRQSRDLPCNWGPWGRIITGTAPPSIIPGPRWWPSVISLDSQPKKTIETHENTANDSTIEEGQMRDMFQTFAIFHSSPWWL